jgi:hypothetical protein
MDSTKKKPMETTNAVKEGDGKKKRSLEEVDISKDRVLMIPVMVMDTVIELRSHK